MARAFSAIFNGTANEAISEKVLHGGLGCIGDRH
jgi:hypothetical protein